MLRVFKEGILNPILIGCPDEIHAKAKEAGFDIEGIEIIDIGNYEEFPQMVDEMFELRRGKMSREECEQALKKSNYFGTMLVKWARLTAFSAAPPTPPPTQFVRLSSW